jgi:hypothetical protein
VISVAIVLLLLSALLYSWCGGQPLDSDTPRGQQIFVITVLAISIVLWLAGFTLLWIAKSFLWAVAGATAAFLLSVALPTLFGLFRLWVVHPSAVFAMFRRHKDRE